MMIQAITTMQLIIAIEMTMRIIKLMVMTTVIIMRTAIIIVKGRNNIVDSTDLSIADYYIHRYPVDNITVTPEFE